MGCVEAGAAELLAGEDAPCKAEGSRTEPEPDACPDEAADDAEMAEKASIYGALTLYLDFINIFLYVVRLLGNNRRRN